MTLMQMIKVELHSIYVRELDWGFTWEDRECKAEEYQFYQVGDRHRWGTKNLSEMITTVL